MSVPVSLGGLFTTDSLLLSIAKTLMHLWGLVQHSQRASNPQVIEYHVSDSQLSVPVSVWWYIKSSMLPLTCISINDHFVLTSGFSHLQVPLSETPVTEHIPTPSFEADDIGSFDDFLRKNDTLTEEEYLPHLPSNSRQRQIEWSSSKPASPRALCCCSCYGLCGSFAPGLPCEYPPPLLLLTCKYVSLYALVCLYSFYVFEKFQERKFDHGTCMLLLVFFVILILHFQLWLWWHMLSLNATINLKCFSNQKAVRVKPVLVHYETLQFFFPES